MTERFIFSKRCWINGALQPATIVMRDGIIRDIIFDKTEGAEDYEDLVIMPGAIDAHVHINEPGRTEWEGFDTATKAAAAGGITSIVDMPLNSSPVTTNLESLRIKQQASFGKMHVHVGFYGGLIPGNLEDLPALIDHGILGIKCFMVHSGIDEFPNVSIEDIDAAMPLLAAAGIPLLAHAEWIREPAICRINEEPSSYREYLASRPDVWETDAIRILVELCRKHRCRVHIVHVSSMYSLPIIRDAKREGLPITAETCPHYIYFNAEEIPDAQPLFKCAPPVRTKAHAEALKQALMDGTLDFIASDHSPAPPQIKKLDSGNLRDAWGGISGLQVLLPVSWTALKANMELSEFIPLLTGKPAQFLGLHQTKGQITKGYDADLVIWDPGQEFTLHTTELCHRHSACPYTGRTLSGFVKETILRGETIFHHQHIQTKHSGQWLKRP
ncbi:MAG TPA: allantoinase AllB [Ferruginibacter sp.]|nr:allantoinase AllB [Ferruginibacter sp.]